MGLLSNTWMGCLLTMLPGPPGIRFHNAYFQMFPVDRINIYCPEIEPGRDIAFRFYFRQFSNESHELRIGDDEKLATSGLDLSLPSVIYFPPFFEGQDGMSVLDVKEAYLQKGGYNFILVDSKRLSAGPWYAAAVSNTYVVGRYAAIFIDYLLSKGLSSEGLHLIGMSIGAHAAGVAGQLLRGGRPPRITGLDPASLLFEDKPALLRLDKTDASFVDIIHTDAWFGMNSAIGHADFFVNEGHYPQPGCRVVEVARRTRRILFTVFCGHLRANQLYAASVRNHKSFPGVQCPSWKKLIQGQCLQNPVEPMGFAASPKSRGAYFVDARSSVSNEKISNQISDEISNEIT